MQKIKFIEDLDTEPLPYDYFDIICGTSTGRYALCTWNYHYTILMLLVLLHLYSEGFAYLLASISMLILR